METPVTEEMVVTYHIAKGPHKAYCEDSALIGGTVINDAAGSVVLQKPCRICLCDGVGGNAGGREASLFVCEHMSDDLIALNEKLIAYGRQRNQPSMATTLTGLHFTEDTVILSHAGNTRLYAIRGGYLSQVTEDQTTYAWLKSMGNLEGAEACNKSEIRCAFGGGSAEYLKSLIVEPVFERRQPRMLLLTTDGVHDYVPVERMEEILAMEPPLMERIDRLIACARENGSEDDCSVIVVEQ